jgi:hypothetical protein
VDDDRRHGRFGAKIQSIGERIVNLLLAPATPGTFNGESR